jgi:hypothetical protein
LKEGPTVPVYDPNEGMYFTRVIGDAYAKSEVMDQAMAALQNAPQLAKVDQGADFETIRTTLEKPDLQLTFQSVEPLANAPFLRVAVYADSEGTKYSVAIEKKTLAGIEPGLS